MEIEPPNVKPEDILYRGYEISPDGAESDEILVKGLDAANRACKSLLTTEEIIAGWNYGLKQLSN